MKLPLRWRVIYKPQLHPNPNHSLRLSFEQAACSHTCNICRQHTHCSLYLLRNPLDDAFCHNPAPAVDHHCLCKLDKQLLLVRVQLTAFDKHAPARKIQTQPFHFFLMIVSHVTIKASPSNSRAWVRNSLAISVCTIHKCEVQEHKTNHLQEQAGEGLYFTMLSLAD